jgi:ATP phosphoribosyltransferase regulatory subunit HisZ
LLEKFGRPAPATGFVVQLDLVTEMLNRASGPPALPRLDAAIAWTGGGLNAALAIGSTLRLLGMRAVVDTETRHEAAAKAWWSAVGAANLIYCESTTEVWWTAQGKRATKIAPDEVAGRLAGGVGA